MKVYLSKLAETKLIDLSKYLLTNWNAKVRNDFITKFSSKTKQISLQPHSCPQSKELNNLFKCVVTRQTTFYYRINENNKEIEIITIFDTRQNPNKLDKEVK